MFCKDGLYILLNLHSNQKLCVPCVPIICMQHDVVRREWEASSIKLRNTLWSICWFKVNIVLESLPSSPVYG